MTATAQFSLGIDLDARTVRLDNTAADILRTCPAKFWARIQRGLVPIAESEAETLPLDLHYGSAWHSAMDALYEEHALGPALTAWEEASAGLAEDKYNRKTQGRGLTDLKDYWDKYESYISGYDLIQSEVIASTVIPMVDPRVDDWTLIYMGAIDKISRLKDNPEVVLVTDHKTSGYVNLYTAPSYELSNQLLGYGYIVRDFFFGGKVSIPAEMTVEADIVAPTRANPPSEFLRPSISVTNAVLDEWREEIVATAWMAVGFAKSGVWPRWGRQACVMYNKLCPYFDRCIVERDIRSVVDDAQYVVQRWHPEDRQ